MPDDVEAAAQRVFELFGAVAANPDDATLGRLADDALQRMERLLLRSADDAAAADGDRQPPPQPGRGGA